jgi:glycerophosphoryl diester phosphodiesterase
MTLDEIRKVEIGSRFSSEFKGEKIPTLKEVIDLARGKIKLQIEMKFYGRDLTLASRVARLIRHENFEKECAIISLNADALREARLVNPLIRTIAIVTVSIGNVDRLDFDGLSVNSRKLKNSLIRSAKAHGKELCAWTVDDPREMVTLIERGVPNIVTNRPDLLVALRTEFESLGEVERRLLAARYLLGMKLDLTPHHLEPPTPEQERP